MDNEFDKAIKEELAHRGSPFMMHTKDCEIWKLEHHSCQDCPHELGCAKYATIRLLMLKPSIYQPKSYQDFESMHKRIQEQITNAMAAKSVAEVQAIV